MCHCGASVRLVSCFNRYMVECEFFPANFVYMPFRRFNRYMVECESKEQIQLASIGYVLIDTWWNVNTIPTLAKGTDNWF